MSRSLASIARELQSASNRLALAEQNQSRDGILREIYRGQSKGARAHWRAEERAVLIRDLRRTVDGLRAALATKLDELDNQSRIH